MKLPISSLLAGAFIFLAPNIDLAYALTFHDGQRLGQLALLGFWALICMIPVTQGQILSVWKNLPATARVTMAVILLLGLVSSLFAELPRFAVLDVSLLVLLVLLVLAVAGDRKCVGGRSDVWLTGLFFATAAAYAVTACMIYIGMLFDAPVHSIGFNIRDLYSGFSNVRFFGHI